MKESWTDNRIAPLPARTPKQIHREIAQAVERIKHEQQRIEQLRRELTESQSR